MALVLNSGPAVEPVSTTEAKAHCRIDISDDDTLVGALIKAGREYMEQRCRRAFVSQTWDLFLDDWPEGDEIKIPLPPLQSVAGVYYIDSDGATATFGTANYLVDTNRQPGRIVLKGAAGWPSTTLRESSGVQVRFTAGYGSAGSTVPQPLRQAVLMLVGHWYENREAIAMTGAVPKEVPFAVDALSWPYRVLEF